MDIIYYLIPIVLTLILFFLSPYFSHLVEKKRKKYKLTAHHIHTNYYYSDGNDKLKIQVKYNGQDIEKGLVKTTIEIKNSGEKGIQFAKHFENGTPITITNTKYKIFDAEIDCDASLKARVAINDDGSASLSWGTLKQKESFKLTLLFEITSDESTPDAELFSCLNFNFRDEEIDQIQMNDQKNQYITTARMFLLLMYLMLSIPFVLHLLTHEELRYSISYHGKIIENTQMWYNRLSGKVLFGHEKIPFENIHDIQIVDFFSMNGWLNYSIIGVVSLIVLVIGTKRLKEQLKGQPIKSPRKTH